MTRKLGKKVKLKTVNKEKLNYVFVATPAYDNKVNAEFCQSMINAVYGCPLFGVKVASSILANGAFIELARNQFVRAFLDDHKECTHLFFVDADLKFPAEAFVGLVGMNLPIVAGVYPKREPTETYPVQWQEHKDGGLWCEDGFIMAKRVPTGFLCIRRDVLQEMADDAEQVTITGTDGLVPWVFSTGLIETDKGTTTMIGEDFQFCDNYIKKYGKPIPVWPDIDFEHGGVKGNLAEYLNRTVNGMNDESETSAA